MDRKWWTLIAVCIGVFMLLLDISIVVVALPDIAKELDGSLADLQWVIDAYALTLAACLLTAGSLADRHGRRRVFAIGIVLFTLGSLLCGVAWTPTVLAVFRALQGIGGAVMFATALALIAAAFPPRERGTAFGAFGATTGVAVAVGPVLGGLLTSLSWRWIFFVNIPVGIAALAIVLARVHESRNPHARRTDVPGVLTFSLGLAALVYGLIDAGDNGWGDGLVAASLVAAAVLLVAFVVIERVGREPMLDLSLLRNPTFVAGLVAAFAVSASIFSLLTYIAIYMQQVLGYSAIATGVRFLTFSGVIFVCAAVAGRLSERVAVRWLIGPGFALLAAGMLLMRAVDPSSDWTALIPGFIAAGLGAGLVNTPLASTAVGVVAPERAGMASGINSTLRQVGIATGTATLGSILSSHIRSFDASGVAPALARRAAFVSGLDVILLIGAVIAAVAAVVTIVWIRPRDFHAAGPQAAAPAAADAQPAAAA